MQRDREHRRVVEEDLLGPVAVVHVPVDDRHARDPALALRPAGGDRDVVDEAEAHRRVALGVVAGRAQEHEGVVELAVEHRLDRAQQPAGGEQHRGVRPRPGPRAVADLHPLPAGHRREHRGDVRVGVGEPQLVLGREARRQLGHRREHAAALEHAPGLGQPLRPLEGRDRRPVRLRARRPAAGRVVADAALVEDEAGPAFSHASRRSGPGQRDARVRGALRARRPAQDQRGAAEPDQRDRRASSSRRR